MWMNFETIKNVRDLGGLCTADGRRVKAGRLLRGAGLHRLSEGDAARLAALPLRHIVDFRDDRELAEHPDPELPGVEYHHLPALPGLPGGPPPEDPSGAPPDFAPLFRGLYAKLAEHPVAAGAYREFFRILLDCREGAVYFHCAQGKDRTGIAALLALTALGVPQPAISADYFLSNEGLRPDLERAMQREGMKWPREALEQLFYCCVQTLSVYLDSVTRAWGGPMGYLRGCLGLTEADIADLRENYLE